MFVKIKRKVLKRIDLDVVKSIEGLLKNGRKRITIVTHVNPDGDAIGSSVGLSNYLRKLGHFCKVLVPNDYPEYLQWMKGEEVVTVWFKAKYKAIEIIENTDILFFLDFNEEMRCGAIAEETKKFKGPRVLIDHHPHPADFTDITISDTGACATAELVYELIDALGDSDLVDESVAECLFSGILTDTGSFNYNTSNPRTYEIVGQLLKTGIDKDRIHSRLFDNFSHDRMKLLGYCLNDKMVYMPEFKTAFFSLTQEELAKFNFKPGDTEGFVNFPLSIKDVVFTAIFMEKDGKIKISFRSKGTFPTNKFASEHFRGGGHVNASGGETNLTMDEAVQKFVDLVPQYAEELKISML
ncbi:bifunctional oligoribonuclease/PAP phosphatase NrnA [Puteibacter caeruleilacunae]|nr:bifunctional oligoribonuclease/PAP phosphatase NrnA [Puteibacter caeruleilacunae]